MLRPLWLLAAMGVLHSGELGLRVIVVDYGNAERHGLLRGCLAVGRLIVLSLRPVAFRSHLR